MTDHIVEIIRRADDEFVEAIVRDELQVSDFTEVENSWHSERLQVIATLNKANVPIDQLPQSLHWNWARKAPQLHLLHAFGFGLICEAEWQGVMLITTATTVARLPTDQGKPVVYIDYLEVAPWNWRLPAIGQDGLYKTIGSILFRQAVLQSVVEGFGGRTGLHSLPQSKGFYENACGMTSLGPDPGKQNLEYLEIGAKQASKYLKEGK